MEHFTAEELTKIIRGAMMIEERLLVGEHNISDVIQKIGIPFVGENGELGYQAKGPEAFAAYEAWVKKTWQVNEVIQRWINTKLGLDSDVRKNEAPAIIPQGDSLCFRCDSCGCEVEDGYVMKNTLRHSPDCKSILKA